MHVRMIACACLGACAREHVAVRACSCVHVCMRARMCLCVRAHVLELEFLYLTEINTYDFFIEHKKLPGDSH